ncbi:NHL repeat-containing protein [Cellulophaga sp. Hel_I_12]|uniref:NHL repeat-containing protein n=1 Tax=Cellulophaga sp. Hel_I_12 TaxID=1249972 RepID=UPI0006900927|nr:NHL repeat-containing protein [Cellulophaga sp. Hel_I_12]
MKNIGIIVVFIILFSSCKQKEIVPTTWVFSSTIQLEGINPIGIAQVDEKLWLSDGDHNRVVQIDAQGKIEAFIDSLDRPMHIDALDGVLYIPQYGNDLIGRFAQGELTSIVIKDSLDAPAAISVFKQEKAIADFYNNRILYYNGTDWISFGKEGKAEGEFYYPTDVQITKDKIWVADAYNNRVQVFDKQGKFLQMMGQDQKMNAATGILVTENEIFTTDFENNRVLVFDMMGNLKQEISKNIEKATDVLIMNSKLYVINYRNGQINIFESEAVPVKIN